VAREAGPRGRGAMDPPFLYSGRNPIPRLSVKWSSVLGQGRTRSGMIRKIITQEFVVPTVLAVALAIVFSVGAIYLTEIFLGPIEQVEAHQPRSP
jgi:hypothetical protein